MKPSASCRLPLLVILFCISASSQNTTNPDEVVSDLKAVNVLPANDGPLIEIVTSGPVNPQVQKLDNPPRLVIDIPGAKIAWQRPQSPVHDAEIKSIRADQRSGSPPTVRIVAMLRQMANFHTEQFGNRITIHLFNGPAQEEHVSVTKSVEATPVPTPRVSGVSLAGSRVPRDSSVTAGADAASLRLRDGEVRICPGTTVSLTPSPNGHDLMLGMSTGTLEAHYSLQLSADSVMTPDFRILLAGPGQFDWAISADAKGNTCVRALPGNTASAIVSELMGDRTYQVKPSEQILFHLGRIDSVDSNIPATCGCPAPATPSAVALNGSTIPLPAGSTSAPAISRAIPSASSSGPETAALPASKPGEVHVTVDEPLVFRATPSTPSKLEVENLPVRAEQAVLLPPEVTPPPSPVLLPPPAQKGPGLFSKVKHFLGRIF